MDLHPLVEQILKLPIQEQLRIVAQIWDNIAEEGEALPLQEWHRIETQRRLEAYERDPSRALTREQMWARVRLPRP